MSRTLRQLYIAIFLSVLCVQTLATPEFKIISLQHRLAEDILPSIQPLVSINGTVTAMQNHLIIRTTAENMAEIEQIINRLDVARQNFKITVSRKGNLETVADSITLSGRKRLGNVEISTSHRQKNHKSGAQISVIESQAQTLSNSEQLINVADGERAFIYVGQSIPYTQEWITLTQRYVHAQRTTEFIDISTGFSVRARSIGKQIEVEITPSIAALNQSGMINFERLSTITLVNQGEWLDLGSFMQQKDEVSRAILNHHNSQHTQNSTLKIRVE